MGLSPRQSARYVRQVLLPEIGTAGQEQLSAARVSLSAQADRECADVAAEYLRRAGIAVVAEGAQRTVEIPDSARVSALSGRPELVHAAAALLGAMAAVEGVKQVLGLGKQADPLGTLSLSSEDV